MFRVLMVIVLELLIALLSDAHPLLASDQHRRHRRHVKNDFGTNNHDTSREKEPWEVNKGLNSTFFQGDIVLSAELQRLVVENANTRRTRAIKKDPKSRWKNGVVPYSLDKRLSQKAKNEIRIAIRHWKRHTCIKFHKKKSGEKDYIHFVAEDGCWSAVGRQGGKQSIGVGDGCEYFGTIIHEIGHALGMWHEQSRSDRDTYVKVIWNNIEKNYHDQFSKMSPNVMDSMGYAYDYESIMHYGSKFFTKNRKHTLRVRKPGREVGVRIGQRKRLSYLDIAQIRAMYNCNKIATPTSAKCFRDRSGKGRSYRGKLAYTEKGVTCQPWNKQWPHKHKQTSSNYFIDFTNGLLERRKRAYHYHNYCRNPGGKRDRPWCFTTLKTPKWQYCDIKIC